MALPVHYNTADRFKFPVTSLLIPYGDARDGRGGGGCRRGEAGIYVNRLLGLKIVMTDPTVINYQLPSSSRIR